MDPHTRDEQKHHDVGPANPVPLSKYSNRVELKTLLERSDGGAGLVGERVVIGGWVKSSRAVKKDSPPPPPLPTLRDALSGGGRSYPVFEKPESAGLKAAPAPPPPSYMFYFLISDGSSVSSLQVVVDSALSTLPATQLMSIGTCIVAEGVLRHPTVASAKHAIELKAEELLHVGTVDPEKYPLSKKQLPLHMLRDFSHFRPRTTTVASVTRIHSALTLATHTFFELNGFQYVQVPVITTTDAEGFGGMFRVTTLLGKTTAKEEEKHAKEKDEISLDAIKTAIKEKSKRIEQLKRTESNRDALVAAVQDLKKASDLAAQMEMRQKPRAGTLVKHDKFDVTKDFFGHETYLTVSGRFHLESYACALGKVYTFGPRFRADKIDNGRHLAEMWDVETEMAFSELDDSMNCGEEFFRFLIKYILENRSEDMKFISKRVDKTIASRLEAVASSPLSRLSYTEVISLLQKATSRKFETKADWGVALTAEHLSYLTDEVYKGPVTIYNYPKSVKPFYVRLNADEKTVAAFDLVVPKVGVLISGSQNEERFEVLDSRIKELGSVRERYEWYLDLRRHGTAKHSGFSLRMELMLLFATGLPDVRDAVPFPRSWGKANN
ncbi:PREDICTED: asparagine--tRNA ligase, cytoplasmic 2 [Tarenaya hassleriana]|uniref:asparagine--tRNA ligase, cytoplasmic 2 n=1 Tax=Tarenaya hassleriana TaxID=28532 RepID=UPI00053CA306|nr:PREDICTED: asparagine--tRNA ligase, cytoplasmic 2 [Tarenaya hassleriana]